MASNFLIESAIFQESEIIKKDSTKNRVRFRSAIQDCDVINQNRRMYPRNVLEEGLNECSPRMQRRAFYSELDHPIPTGNQQVDLQRQTTVLLKEASHIIREYQFNGNMLEAVMETLSTPNGYTLAGLIKDKTGAGFSMRGLGELERMHDYNLVKSPLTIISFDAVSSPSHAKAYVSDFDNIQFESSLITESKNLVCCNGTCYLPNYFDKLVETKIIKFYSKWI